MVKASGGGEYWGEYGEKLKFFAHNKIRTLESLPLQKFRYYSLPTTLLYH